jgi:hypothetical protein
VNLRGLAVKRQQAKRADRLGPKGAGVGKGPERQPFAIASTPRRIAGTYPREDLWSGTWKPRPVARTSGQVNRKGICWLSGTGCWRKRMPACNESDTGIVPGPKGSRLPAGAPTRESMENRRREGRRRTAVKAAGAPSTLEWSAVDWRPVSEEVWRLHVGIAEAVRQFRRDCWVGKPAFGVLEPCAGKLARRVLRGAGGR